MNQNHVKRLITVPATNENYKRYLQAATVKEIKEALSIMDVNGVVVRGDATRITFLKRELQKRSKQRRKSRDGKRTQKED